MMSVSLADLAALAGAVVLAGLGGEAFLKSILGVAMHLRLPKAVVATTLAAFATSSPELTVSTIASLAGEPAIGLGDALGSNVVNIALIFGLALLFGGIQTRREEFGRDFYLALAVPLITLLLAADGRLSFGDGAILVLLFSVWLLRTLQITLQQRPAAGDAPEGTSTPFWRTVFLGITGLAALIAAGRLFVLGATGIAASFAVDTFVIGVVLVAIGTSLPELVTVLLSRLRGHDDVGVGTLIGSNLFNGLAIVGVASSIQDINLNPEEVGLTLAVGVLALLLLIPLGDGQIPRQRAFALLILYALFTWATLAS